MINNPVSFHIDGSTSREFTYEGGSKLFHFSPHDNGLSKSMEMNVIFPANDEAHARDVLRRMFEFAIECLQEYRKNVDPSSGQWNDYFLERDAKVIDKMREYLERLDDLVITEAPTNQFFKVSWAGNDTV